MPGVVVDGMQVAFDIGPQSRFERTEEDFKPQLQTRVFNQAILPVVPKFDQLARTISEDPGHIQADLSSTIFSAIRDSRAFPIA
jgi:hypothetical protein